MCWLRMACVPLVRQKVFFSSPPQRQQFGQRAAQVEGLRRVAARAPHDALGAFEDAHHGIVGAHVDVAVVHQEPVGHAAQALARHRRSSTTIGSSLRLPLVITSAANARAAEQQVMQRRVGQHHAQRRIAGRDRLGQFHAVAPRQDHDGVARTA